MDRKERIPLIQRTPVDITDPEYQISQVAATMAMEGLILTEEDKQKLRDIYDGKITVEEAIEEIKQKYTQSEV